MSKEKTGTYTVTQKPLAYVSNSSEITNLDGNYLVKGSRDVLIRTNKDKGKVVSRKGYTLKGAAKTLNKGIVERYGWKTSTQVKRNIRVYYDTMQVWYDSAWVTLKTGFLGNSAWQFAEWWNSSELIDVLIGVNGTSSVFEWSGSIAKVASVTANTITKKGYLAGATIAFVEGGASADSITDSANGFVTAGFEAGQEIVVTGSASNNGVYTIATVAAGTLTLVSEDDLTAEGVGASVIIKDSAEGTWAEARAFTAGTRKFTINGVEYTYTGGETTGTLTGVTPDPSAGGVVADDIALQSIRETAYGSLTSGWGESYEADLIGVFNNYIFYGSYKSRYLYISKSTNFKDFGYTAARVPTEGFLLTLDATPTAIVPDGDAVKISAGTDYWYEVRMTLAADQATETVTVKRLPTATGQAALNPNSVVYIKNNVAFLSQEPTIDTLGNVENVTTQRSLPISDDIKDDLEAYDLTGASGIYWRREVRFALPAEGIELIYDISSAFWQAPQYTPISCYDVIDGVLCGHSASSNETYILDDGYNANGAPMKPIAAFGYENYGRDFEMKQFDEVLAKLKMSPNTIVTDRVNYDYKGATAVREFTIDGSDASISFTPSSTPGLGEYPLGTNPFGSTTDPNEGLSMFRVVNQTSVLDFFERQRVFYSNSVDARFEILAYGENARLSPNDATFIKR